LSLTQAEQERLDALLRKLIAGLQRCGRDPNPWFRPNSQLLASR
jgi:hypothetical protein